MKEQASMIQFIIPCRVAPGSVNNARATICRFLRTVQDREPGSMMYKSLQYMEDHTRFVYVLIFKSREPGEMRRDSLRLRQFVEVLQPLCTEKPICIKASELV